MKQKQEKSIKPKKKKEESCSKCQEPTISKETGHNETTKENKTSPPQKRCKRFNAPMLLSMHEGAFRLLYHVLATGPCVVKKSLEF